MKTTPVLSVYLFAPTENNKNSSSSSSNSNSNSSSNEGSGSKGGKHLQLIKKSDLEGGLSDDGRMKSSAAQDLLQRKGVLNITLVELCDTAHAYIIFISTPPKSGSSSSSSSSSSSNSSSSSSSSSTAEAGVDWEPTPWLLHVISDRTVQCTAL
ncbi:hypothetical protein EPH_0008180 [Eimeria praecox]|uniref:Uncharacterized protein n=1 Tax=Eimeria praecox TaxID=51316 RepID=U6GFE0_9EIME|nr:hypothetical protein EPH_0008180 [Eimeria praecox]